MSTRAEILAANLETGAAALAAFASSLTPAEWETRLPRDGRKVGIVVHHVASVHPLEVELAQKLAAGGALTDVTRDAVHEMNAVHARKHDGTTHDDVKLHQMLHAGEDRRNDLRVPGSFRDPRRHSFNTVKDRAAQADGSKEVR